MNLGYMYAAGRGVAQDYKEAVKWYRKAAQQNAAVVQISLGVMFAQGRGVSKDDREAVKWSRLAAEQNIAVAQFILGWMFEQGRGVPQDDKEAVKWYRKAAQQGSASAQSHLGVMYAHGRGVPQDDKEAVKWYRKAAQQNNAAAQADLGYMHAEGRGVPQDDKEAVKWYRLAAQQGFVDAQYNLGVMYAHGRGVPQDDKEAVKWYRKAAQQNNAAAQADLGYMHAEGRGVSKDDKEAVKWYRKAAGQNNAWGQVNLGVMYWQGRGVAKDWKEAVKWFRLAAQQGHVPAQHNLVLALKDQGKFAEAQKVAQACLKSLPAKHPLRRAVSEQLKECERLLALDNKLADILQQKSQPANADEQIQLALLCALYKRRPATATRFFAAAFAAKPELANDLASSYRYDAACAAALAAAGKGDDTTKLDGKKRTRLRQQALGWLQADLTAYTKLARSAAAQDRQQARRALQHWQKDPTLASVRDKAALDSLPEPERAAWRKLWGEVAKLLANKIAPRKAGGAASAPLNTAGLLPSLLRLYTNA
jgi:TPR repeat protein